MSATMHPALKYPVRQFGWIVTNPENIDGEFVELFIEDSTLGGNGNLDPWKRAMPSRSTWRKHSDSEGEITFWTTQTTVEGQPVMLKIFND